MSKRMIADYKRGLSLKQISDKWSTTVYQARKTLLDAGVKLRTAGRPKHLMRQSLMAARRDIMRQHKRGVRVAAIAAAWGVRPDMIYQIIGGIR